MGVVYFDCESIAKLDFAHRDATIGGQLRLKAEIWRCLREQGLNRQASGEGPAECAAGASPSGVAGSRLPNIWEPGLGGPAESASAFPGDDDRADVLAPKPQRLPHDGEMRIPARRRRDGRPRARLRGGLDGRQPRRTVHRVEQSGRASELSVHRDV